MPRPRTTASERQFFSGYVLDTGWPPRRFRHHGLCVVTMRWPSFTQYPTGVVYFSPVFDPMNVNNMTESLTSGCSGDRNRRDSRGDAEGVDAKHEYHGSEDGEHDGKPTPHRDGR
jgi:hypothetical protein